MCLHRTRQWVMLNTAMEITWLPLVSVPNAAEWRIIQVTPHVNVGVVSRFLSFALTLTMQQYNIFKVKKGMGFRCSLVIQFCAFILILLRWLTAVPVQAPAILVGGGCCFLLWSNVIFILGILSDLRRHINDSHELEVPHSFKNWILSCIIFIASGVDK